MPSGSDYTYRYGLPVKTTSFVLQRSTSFGRFEGLRHHSSHAKPEDNGTTVVSWHIIRLILVNELIWQQLWFSNNCRKMFQNCGKVCDIPVFGMLCPQLREDCESPDPHKSTGLGKKMKEISLTMRRKMGKKHAKSFSEETVSLFFIQSYIHV